MLLDTFVQPGARRAKLWRRDTRRLRPDGSLPCCTTAGRQCARLVPASPVKALMTKNYGHIHFQLLYDIDAQAWGGFGARSSS